MSTLTTPKKGKDIRNQPYSHYNPEHAYTLNNASYFLHRVHTTKHQYRDLLHDIRQLYVTFPNINIFIEQVKVLTYTNL